MIFELVCTVGGSGAFTKDLEELRQEAAADAALAPWMLRLLRLLF
jgi:hypothetical protein